MTVCSIRLTPNYCTIFFRTYDSVHFLSFTVQTFLSLHHPPPIFHSQCQKGEAAEGVELQSGSFAQHFSNFFELLILILPSYSDTCGLFPSVAIVMSVLLQRKDRKKYYYFDGIIMFFVLFCHRPWYSLHLFHTFFFSTLYHVNE